MPIVQQHPFTAADATTVNGLAGTIGGNMTVTSGTWLVYGNAAVPTADNNGRTQTPPIGASDYTLRFRLKWLTAGFNGIAVVESRVSNGSGTHYYLLVRPGNGVGGTGTELYYWNGSSGTQVGSTHTWSPGPTNDVIYTFEVIHEGTTHTVKRDGVTIIGPSTHSGNLGTDGVRMGISTTVSTSTESWHFDSLEVETPGSSTAIPAFGRYRITSPF